MRHFLHIFLLAAALILGGCASVPTASDQVVTLPETTPFDSNSMMRQAYLDAYRDGYRSVAYGGSDSVDSIRGPSQRAREMGFRAGAADARRHQENAR